MGSGLIRHPTAGQSRLMAVLGTAHAASARRNNASSHAVRNAAAGSGSYTCAIAAALLTLGRLHGPLTATQQLLESGYAAAIAAEVLDRGERVPGWGNSFVKDGEDPDWLPVRECLAEIACGLVVRIDSVTTVLHGRGKRVFPNPSAYTAASAIMLGIPAEASAYLFVSMRLEVWTELFLKEIGRWEQ